MTRLLALPAVLAAALALPGCGALGTGSTAPLGATVPVLLERVSAPTSAGPPATATSTGPSATAPSATAPSATAPSATARTPLPCHPQPALPAAGGAEPLRATIAVVVPATTLVRLDPDGRPTTARTNTGQAPCRTDVFVVAEGDVSTPAPADVRAAVLAATAGTEDGRWTPGTWRPLAPTR